LGEEGKGGRLEGPKGGLNPSAGRGSGRERNSPPAPRRPNQHEYRDLLRPPTLLNSSGSSSSSSSQSRHLASSSLKTREPGTLARSTADRPSPAHVVPTPLRSHLLPLAPHTSMDSPSARPHGAYRPKQPSLLSRALSNQQASPIGSSSGSPRSRTSSTSSSSSSTSASFAAGPGSPAGGGGSGALVEPPAAFATPPRRRRSVYHPPSPASVTRGGSTVPFDFAASERAAREALARDEAQPSAPSNTTSGGREVVPRRRVVRRKSLYQRCARHASLF